MYSEELQVIKVRLSDAARKSDRSVNVDFINRPFYFVKAVDNLIQKQKTCNPLVINFFP